MEQFYKAETPWGTQLLMIVAGQTLEEWEGEEAFFPLGVLGSEAGP